MKVVSYVIFRGEETDLFRFYEMGIDYNSRMNKLIYPDWKTVIHKTNTVARCEAMLNRLKPLWWEGVTHVICRDLDSITTYREAQSVQRWINSGREAHGMNDAPAHGGMHLMGGMCGFKPKRIIERYKTFEELIEGFDLTKHGSDQDLLMQRIYPLVFDSMYFEKDIPHTTDNPLWESELCSRHIGSAGFNEMETIRFLKRNNA